jgi:hypothetical protein
MGAGPTGPSRRGPHELRTRPAGHRHRLRTGHVCGRAWCGSAPSLRSRTRGTETHTTAPLRTSRLAPQRTAIALSLRAERRTLRLRNLHLASRGPILVPACGPGIARTFRPSAGRAPARNDTVKGLCSSPAPPPPPPADPVAAGPLAALTRPAAAPMAADSDPTAPLPATATPSSSAPTPPSPTSATHKEKPPPTGSRSATISPSAPATAYAGSPNSTTATPAGSSRC